MTEFPNDIYCSQCRVNHIHYAQVSEPNYMAPGWARMLVAADFSFRRRDGSVIGDVVPPPTELYFCSWRCVRQYAVTKGG